MKPIKQSELRKLHVALVPIMLVPLLLTLVTGSLFQLAVVSGNGDAFLWLLELHRGQFGRIHLEMIYPFFNALGLLAFIITGILMWLRVPRRAAR